MTNKYKFALIFILCGCSQLLLAQLELVPIVRKQITPSEQTSVERSKQADFPFVDDFSATTKHVDPANWSDDLVYVNSHLAQNPPSIGVATLDGLDGKGFPYSVRGTGDTLTSRAFDLSGQNRVYLSFFYQPQGNGLPSHSTADSLVVEVRRNDGTWKRVWSVSGLKNGNDPNTSIPEFALASISISQEDIYDGFQFRFRNKSDVPGYQDFWHLDYVRLSAEEGRSEFHDLSFTAIPNQVFKPYTAMPMTELLANYEDYAVPQYEVQVENHSADILSANPSNLTVHHLSDNRSLLTSDFRLLEIIPGGENQQNPNPGRHSYSNPSPFVVNDDLKTNIQSLDPNEFHQLRIGYSFNQDRENNEGVASYISNNRVYRDVFLENYLAYDDGTAESGIAPQNNGRDEVIIAQEFNISQSDTLKGIQMHFPFYGKDFAGQSLKIQIWKDDLNTDPIFTMDEVSLLYPNSITDSLTVYTTYALIDNDGLKRNLYLSPGKFYIGFTQNDKREEVNIPIGFDLDSPYGADYMYYAVKGEWSKVSTTNPEFKGSMMLRALLSGAEVYSTPVVKPTRVSDLSVFPNPSTGIINIASGQKDFNKGKLKVYDYQGKLVYRGMAKKVIDLNFLSDGWYSITWLSADGKRYDQKSILIQGK